MSAPIRSALVRKAYALFYPAETYVDEDALFDRAIRAGLRPGMRMLDAGAGAGELYDQDYRQLDVEVIGIDLDPRVTSNPTLSQGLVGSLEQIPLPDAHVDLICCRYVFEHLPDPERVAAEFRRVLRPGGLAIVMTPNRYHYVTVASSLTPLWFHQAYNELRGRSSHDTFPTHYRANSRATMESQFQAAGFSECHVEELEMAPNYLTLTTPTFLLGVAYERLVNRFDALSRFRVLLLGQFRV